jgi:hypothetical protein
MPLLESGDGDGPPHNGEVNDLDLVKEEDDSRLSVLFNKLDVNGDGRIGELVF